MKSEKGSGRGWPTKILGPAPGLKELNLACWGLFLGLAVVPICIPIWISIRSGVGIRGILPIDFVYFYGIGQLCHQYSVARLYDYALQLKIFNDIFPVSDGAYGPSPYSPLVAMILSMYARLPFSVAYGAWLATSLALFAIGIGSAIRAAHIKVRLQISLIFCCVLAFSPFLVSTLANGQLASVAVFALGLSMLQERNSRPFVSGLMLSILAYKPTLLLLILPMLLVTRRWRAFLGFIAGLAGLTALTTAFTGWRIWLAYFQFLRYFSQAAGVNGQSVLLRWKYEDLNSFTYGIPGGRSTAGIAIFTGIAVAVGGWLAVLLWRSAKCDNPVQSLAWAATLTWTLLLNVYVPIYDSILVCVAAIVMIGALREFGWRSEEGWTVVLAVATVAVSWSTLAFARTHGIQLLTIALAVLGFAQLWLLQRATSQAAASGASAVNDRFGSSNPPEKQPSLRAATFRR